MMRKRKLVFSVPDCAEDQRMSALDFIPGSLESYIKEEMAAEERAVFGYIHDNAHDLTVRPHDMMMDGNYGVCLPSRFLPNLFITRLDVTKAFLCHPRSLPVELKGIAV